jgi:hypothetical protein
LSVSQVSDDDIILWWNWAHSVGPDGPQQPEEMDSIVFIPPVWVKTNTRRITIPANTRIFIPVYNVVTSNKIFGHTNPRDDAKIDIDNDKGKLSLKIDGHDYFPNTYRPRAPIKFEFNALQFVRGSGQGRGKQKSKGIDKNAYADGYYFVHPAFQPGSSHTIEVNQRDPTAPISITWDVTVA